MSAKITSRCYNYDCICKKKEITTYIFIQCEVCIDPPNEIRQLIKHGYDCACIETSISYNGCICTEYREKIDLLKDELDYLMYFTMVNEIKQYKDCDDKLSRIKQISIELRQLNRMLLENLVKISN